MIQASVADPVVVDLELVDPPHVGDLELGLVRAVGPPLERRADEGVNADKL